MNKKFILLIVFLFLITGCSTTYNIEFSNKKIKENIVMDIKNSDFPSTNSEVASVDDRLTPFIEDDQYPISHNENIKYKKSVKDTNDGKKITLNYTYTHDEYRNSTVLNQCFDKASFVENRKDYDIKINGKFFCNYTDNLVINLKTNNKVLSHNATSVKGNVYTWVIDKKNLDDININIKISKETKIKNIILYMVAGIIMIILIGFGYVTYKKIQSRDSVNEI